MKEIDVEEFIPFSTRLDVDIKTANCFKQKIILHGNDEIMCYMVKLEIVIQGNNAREYYDVGACRVMRDKMDNVIMCNKLRYGLLFNDKINAENMFYSVIRDVKKDLQR